MADERQTNWLVFAAGGDSLQFFLQPGADAYLTMEPPNAAGAGTENSLRVDASWLRARFPTNGTYVFTAGLEADNDAPYELRLAPVVTTGASQPTGGAATLTLVGPRRARIAVAPQSMMPQTDTTAMRRFAVAPGQYRVLLVRDTVYVACKLPCTHRDSFTLTAGKSARITP
jgi:hypothetical protein